MTDVGTPERADVAAETEAPLREFWAELLEREEAEIAEDDSLLGLGGNSLIATMVANRIELAWGFRPSMEELLTCTFGELTEICVKLKGGVP